MNKDELKAELEAEQAAKEVAQDTAAEQAEIIAQLKAELEAKNAEVAAAKKAGEVVQVPLGKITGVVKSEKNAFGAKLRTY